MAKENIPAISVIIPMYNAEKYIVDCFESILAQSFKDFEVIVVDDCSTDNSAKIVESYVPKFTRGGAERLQLVRRKTNSGGCGVPRNDGLEIAHGEYISFIDMDDMITPTAFEELYTVAKEFDADVVACEKYFQIPAEANISDKSSCKFICPTAINFVEKPTLVKDNIETRIKRLYNKQFLWNVWSKLIRRNFLSENGINFVDNVAEDVTFTIFLVCAAKKYVLVPNVINFYRIWDESLSRKKIDTAEPLYTRIHAITVGISALNNFFSKNNLLENTAEEKYDLLFWWIIYHIDFLREIYSQIPPYQIYDLVKKEFETLGCDSELTALLFNGMNIFNNINNQQRAQIQQLQEKLQKAAEYLGKQQKIIRDLESQLK